MSGDYGQGSPADERLTVTQLATELGVTAETITGWIAEGKDIPHFQVGPQPDQIRRFQRRDIAPLLAEHGVEEAGR